MPFRVLKSTTNPSSSTSSPQVGDGHKSSRPTSPTKSTGRASPSKSTGRASPTKLKSSAARSGQTSPSKIPIPVTPVSKPTGGKDFQRSPDPVLDHRSNNFAFLQSHFQQGKAPPSPTKDIYPRPFATPASPAPAPAPVQTNYQAVALPVQRAPHAEVWSEDVHMQTLKDTIDPKMLKQLSNITAPPSKVAMNGFTSNGGSEDVHMKTHAKSMSKSERGLSTWERQLLESPDTKRKATVAQICEPTKGCKVLTIADFHQTSWTITVGFLVLYCRETRSSSVHS